MESEQWDRIFIGDDVVYDRPLGIGYTDFLRHMYVVGKTGTGKTTLQTNIVLQMVDAGKGVCFIDPHGDAVETILEYIPTHRTNDVIYFNPSDAGGDYPIAFNVLANVGEADRARKTGGVVSAFVHIMGGDEEKFPRITDLLFNSVYALMEAGNASLGEITRLLDDKEYRRMVVRKTKNEEVRNYWLNEYEVYSERARLERTESTRNKIRQLLVQPALKNIVGQLENRINMREVMDSGKVLLVNLSKGNIGSNASKLLGGILVHEIKNTALQRADVPESKRPFFGLVVDEFPNYGGDVYTEILSEARKYGLGLLLGHQYVSQVDESITSAIVGNAGSLISFQVGSEDAWVLHKELDCNEETLMELHAHRARIRLTNDSETQNARTIQTRDMLFPFVGNRENIKKETRRRYCRPSQKLLEKRHRANLKKIQDMLVLRYEA